MKEDDQEPKEPVGIHRAREGMSENGGYSRKQIIAIGLPWPLPKGKLWDEQVAEAEATEAEIKTFLRLRGKHLERKIPFRTLTWNAVADIFEKTRDKKEATEVRDALKDLVKKIDAAIEDFY